MPQGKADADGWALLARVMHAFNNMNDIATAFVRQLMAMEPDEARQRIDDLFDALQIDIRAKELRAEELAATMVQ